MDKQSHLDQPLPSSLYLLDQTVQVQCIHTILRYTTNVISTFPLNFLAIFINGSNACLEECY